MRLQVRLTIISFLDDDKQAKHTGIKSLLYQFMSFSVPTMFTNTSDSVISLLFLMLRSYEIAGLSIRWNTWKGCLLHVRLIKNVKRE
jgi:hypothetical protein